MVTLFKARGETSSASHLDVPIYHMLHAIWSWLGFFAIGQVIHLSIDSQTQDNGIVTKLFHVNEWKLVHWFIQSCTWNQFSNLILFQSIDCFNGMFMIAFYLLKKILLGLKSIPSIICTLKLSFTMFASQKNSTFMTTCIVLAN